MNEMPQALADLLAEFETITDRYERYELLTEYADEFKEVPPSIARRPFPSDHRVPHCESQVYMWAQDQGDHSLKFYFAVENPQGLSARAMAAILDQTCSGAPAWQVQHIPDDLPQRLFGSDLSMGRTLGLMGMVALVKAAARRHVRNCPTCQAQDGQNISPAPTGKTG